MSKSVAYKPIRWTREMISKEFSIDPKTLAKRLTEGSILPGDDGMFSTGQADAAKHGDLASEKLGKAKADREKAEVEAAKAKAEVVLSEDADATLADYGTAVRSIIESARFLAEDHRAKLLSAVQQIEIDPAPAADGTARKTKAKK